MSKSTDPTPTGAHATSANELLATPPERMKCQGCARLLIPLKDGTAPRHNFSTSRYADRCGGSGFRMARWPVGQLLNHHTGDIWEITKNIGGEYGDYRMRCVSGREEGREMVAHGEYLHRHGWQSARLVRYVLQADAEGVVVARGVFDREMRMWCETDRLGPFLDRTEAREYMIATTDERKVRDAAVAA